MPKNGFPMPTAKNWFQILNLHPKKHRLKKNMVLNQNITGTLYAEGIFAHNLRRFCLFCTITNSGASKNNYNFIY